MINSKPQTGIVSGDTDVKLMDNKKLLIIAASIVVITLVVLVAAFVVLYGDNGSQSATPTPAPETTTGPSTVASTATPTPTAKPASTDTPTPAPGGPIIIQAQANRTSGMCFISFFLNTGAAPIDTGKLKINIECEGKTYANVWTLKPAEWDNSDGDILLDPNEAIATQVNTNALGIPQGKVMTIKVLQDSVVLQEKSVTPT
jgi:hypothetical protein